MTFKSEKQRKWMHANEPKMAKKWEKKKKTEAFRPSDRKVLMVIGRDVIQNLNKNYHKGTLTPNKQLGHALNSIFRAMTRDKSDANYQQYKKYFPKYNDKLLKRLSKAYFDQPVNVQNTFVRQVMDYSLKESVKEEKKRDYKAEYKKFQSSTKAKKYRAELNKYNRKKGTYGNGDGKDASHKGGKIVGFEAESKNRGRAEKSRLKKEGVITENPAAIAAGVRAAMARAKEKELAVSGGKKVKVSTALANKSHPKHKQAKGIIQRIKDKAKSMLAKSKKKKAEPKKQSKSDANFYARQFGATSEGKIIEINGIKYSPVEEGFGGELKGADKKKFEKARKENAEVLGYKLTGKSDIKESVNEADMKAIANVVKKRQAKKIDGMLMDLTTANAVIKVYKALNQSNKKKFAELPLKKMVNVTWKLVK